MQMRVQRFHPRRKWKGDITARKEAAHGALLAGVQRVLLRRVRARISRAHDGAHLHHTRCNWQTAKHTGQGCPLARVAVLLVVRGAVHATAAAVLARDGTKWALQAVRCGRRQTEIGAQT